MMKSKTMWFAMALAVLGAVEAGFGLIRVYIGESVYGPMLMTISVIVAVLRVITTMPLNEK